jgi:hypothetical protein
MEVRIQDYSASNLKLLPASSNAEPAHGSAWLALEKILTEVRTLTCVELGTVGESFMKAGRLDQAVIAFAIGGFQTEIMRCARIFRATGDEVSEENALELAEACNRFSVSDLQNLSDHRS